MANSSFDIPRDASPAAHGEQPQRGDVGNGPADDSTRGDRELAAERQLPGLSEAVGWSVGVSLAHIAASLLLLLIVGWMLVQSGQWNAVLLGELVLPDEYLLMLLGGDQMLVLLATLCAIRWRFGRQLTQRLNLTGLHPLHALLVAGLTLPLSSLSAELYRAAEWGWRGLIQYLPGLAIYDQWNTVDFLQTSGDWASWPGMLLVLAVGPALSEELVFRGIIGRGLVGRWGLWTGVLVTSLMFAGAHLHPVHVFAVIPIGIALHLVYLATRSFWAPVLLHFLNNAWATAQLKLSTEPAAVATSDAAGFGLLVASVVAIIVLGTLLYHTRTRYLLHNGLEWNPGYTTAEAPPPSLSTAVTYGEWSHRHLATAATAWASFAVAFVAEVTAWAR